MEIERMYKIEGPSSSNQYTATYREQSWERITLPLLRVQNDYGLKMWFIYDGNFNDQSGSGVAPYGARLFRATFAGEELLYTNPRGKISPNWGPWYPDHSRIQGWIGWQ